MSYKGLKEGGVDWALDKDNRAVVSPEIEKRQRSESQHHQRQGQGARLPHQQRLPGLIFSSSFNKRAAPVFSGPARF
ncbi:hypothetical protein LP419_10855 [Massilia sp. H-1]|nr:hypothetical protein LP419_10855 [Massilia sp. H-1]